MPNFTASMKKIAVLLSGSGVYDGSEIQESVFTLMSIAEHGRDYQCIAPNVDQHHVINHTTGDEMSETRNVLVESARIARGDVKSISDVNVSDYDALVMPGGFGAAKNLTSWAFNGPDGDINESVKKIILEFHSNKKPIVALCMAPTTVAKALDGSGISSTLTVGSSAEESPYDIAAISAGMEKIGAKAEMKNIKEISYDADNKIITAPCYMMKASILEVRNNVKQAIDKLFEVL